MRLRKTLTALAACAALCSPPATADEGMWLPMLISQRIEHMQSKGFTLDAEDIYSINQASLKDAVVLFGGGCTGEVVSPEGLLFTNHHCGYSYIQKHSSVSHDYLRDGFWALDRDEELPNPGLSVMFLEYMQDVTAEITASPDRQAAIDSLTSAATAAGKGLSASVEELYYGNRYFLFVYKEFTDVRLVGAPPSSIGKFGGDTDNWMWPRHTGDFSIFRIYAGKDNEPAPYSEDNVPYRPRKYFRISTGGVQEGDFTFIYGFPGSTREYVTSDEVRYIGEISDPAKIALRTMRLEIMKKYMDGSQDVRIRYSSKYANVANAWKKWQGESGGIERNGTVEEKEAYEARFAAWAEGSRYEGLPDRLDSLYALLEPWNYAREYLSETALTVELPNFATACLSAPESERPALAEEFYRDWWLPIDKECFIAVMQAYLDNVPEEFRPPYYAAELGRLGSIEAWAEDIFGGGLASGKLSGIEDDPAYRFRKESVDYYNGVLLPEYLKLSGEINALYKDYMQGQIEFEPDKDFYPDANLTLRVAYGNVAGYAPADGVYYKPVSTLTGIMEKDDPGIFDYNVPQKLRELYATGLYDDMPVCFIATNHTSGGNSGSPVIDKNGNLIGLNFDRVWEGTMSDIAFDPAFCRNICLDIRYLLFVVDKVCGAGALLDELEFAE